MQAENNNDIAITEAKLKDFLSSVLSSEGIVVDIRRTFIEYNGVNRSRVFARHANRMACKGSIEKFVVIALLCYPALQWLLKAQDIDALIEKLKDESNDYFDDSLAEKMKDALTDFDDDDDYLHFDLDLWR